jgi:hypothetical protein
VLPSSRSLLLLLLHEQQYHSIKEKPGLLHSTHLDVAGP